MGYDDHGGWRPYITVAQRRRQAAREVAALRKKGRSVDPVNIGGQKIARTFWGQAWCGNLESYSDYANRLPRGRTYVRNGSVIDLRIDKGQVAALVSGSSIYVVDISIRPAKKARWKDLIGQCAGKIDSVVELLQGRFSKGVMKILARRDTGLFPSPREIELTCSCPDWAAMCKHVAAVLYGIGARLDHAPEMLFVLRGVDPMDLVAQAGHGGVLSELTEGLKAQILDAGSLSSIFGIDIADSDDEGIREMPRSGPKAGGSSSRPDKDSKKAGRPAKRSVAGSRRQTKSGLKTAMTRQAKSPPRKLKRRPRRITARELIEHGIPRSTFQNWIASGVLKRTPERGAYRTTPTAEERIQAKRAK